MDINCLVAADPPAKKEKENICLVVFRLQIRYPIAAKTSAYLSGVKLWLAKAPAKCPAPLAPASPGDPSAGRGIGAGHRSGTAAKKRRRPGPRRGRCASKWIKPELPSFGGSGGSSWWFGYPKLPSN